MEKIVWLLVILFLIALFIVCGKKGFRSLFSLGLTMFALIFVFTPLIVHGYDPIFVTLFLGLPVMALIVYFTEGFKILSHLSVIAVIFNFLLISGLIHIAVSAAGLTGIVSSDASFLGLTGINLQELLIAGIMISTLGILTEMVVTQIATVIEFSRANPDADAKVIFRQAYSVGIVHLGSVINTLFLVYAGVSFPLLIIYAGSKSSLYSALNYEPLVSEIIRTLAGTIGLIIAMPTSTLFAVWWLKKQSKKNNI